MDSTMTQSVEANIQHVNRKSSEELLKKFADEDDDNTAVSKRKELVVLKKKRRKRSRRGGGGELCDQSPCSAGNGVGLVERRSLLPAPSAAKRRSVLLRQLRVKEFKNKSFFGALEKTWRRTIEGASRVLLENHYSRHKRLINNDVV